MRNASRLTLVILPVALPARAQWTIDGVGVCTAAGDQTVPAITFDGAGGAIVIWTDQRSGTSDVYAQRINSTAAPQWMADGVAIRTASNAQIYPQMATGG